MIKNYPAKKLGEVCDILIGGTPSRGTLSYWKNGTLPWVSIRDMSREGDLIKNTSEKITEKGAKESSVKLIPKGSLLFSFKLSIGKLAIAGSDLYTNEAIAALVIKKVDELDRDFLRYYISQMTFEDVTSAVKGKTLNKEKIKEIEIPLPPLAIQKQIVAKLDEKFAKLREAKRLREEAIADTEKILSQTLKEIFEEGKEKGWEEKTLGSVCLKTKNINWYEHKEKEFEYIDLTSVSRETFKILETQQITASNAPSRARKIVQTDDVIFGTTRPTLMRVTVISKEHDEQICSTGFCVLRANSRKIISSLIFYFIQSAKFMDRMEKIQKGASYPAVSDSKVLETCISLPPLSEQQSIVTRLDALSAKLKNLRELQKSQLEDFKKLEKAYLKEAFNGELV